MSPQEKEALIVHQARKNLIDFAIATDPNYQDTPFHETLAAVLQSSVEKVENNEDVRIILTTAPRHGKALALDTPIPTPSGWTTIDDIKVGDYVFDENGKPTRVVAVSEVWKDRNVYKVTDKQGNSVVADESHEWYVRLDRKHKYWKKYDTKYLASRVGKRRPLITKSPALEFDKKMLEIDPYVLGIWLGDGNERSARVSKGIGDLPFLRQKIESRGYLTKSCKDLDVFLIKELQTQLRKMGLLKNKHIPRKYLESSVEQRMALLQGLVDTDGYVAGDGQVELCTISKDLADGYLELVKSLGVKAIIINGKATLNGRYISEKYRVMFYMKDAASMPRKNVNTRNSTRTPGQYLSFEYAGIADTKCIEVESPTHMFLCGKGLWPTCNSEMTTKKFPSWVLGKHPEWPVIVTAYSAELATDFGQGTRDIMQSDYYKKIFPSRLRLDAKAKGKWLTEEGGGYISAGAGGAITGKGFKIGIIDDPFKNRDEAESKTIRDSRWSMFLSTFYTRQEGATAIIVIATRWHTDDLIGRLLKKQEEDERNGEENYDKWVVVEFPAIATKDEVFRKKGDPLWPEKFPINKLQTIKNTLGPYEWSALYQCTPITSENQEFQDSWFKRRSWAEVEALNTRKFATIDPGGKNEENDRTGIVRNYVDNQNNWNIKAMGVHFDSKELLSYIFILHDEGMEKIGIEETVYLKAVKPFFDEECRKRNKFPNVIPLKQPSTQKEVRIRGLIPRYASGSIYHIDNDCSDLVDELIVFPKGAHDDVPDALAMQNDIAESPLDDYKITIMKHQREERRSAIKRQYGLN